MIHYNDCIFNYYPQQQPPQQMQVVDFSEDDMEKLIRYIQTAIDIPLPKELIKEILDAELRYFTPASQQNNNGELPNGN